MHVDGAFGLWAAVSDSLRHLVDGVERADSWATDAHKWLNVPYDCGIAFSAHPESHRAAFSARAAYLIADDDAARADRLEPRALSSRARVHGVRGDPLARARRGRRHGGALLPSCRRFAAGLEDLGAEVLNDVELNQVLFRFASDAETNEALRAVQESGEAWMSGTTWDGRAAIRISVSNWQTSDEDVERTLAAYAGQLAAR